MSAAEARRRWKARNIPRVRAHNRVLERVRRAVRRGFLAKHPCFCGEPRVQAHHPRGYEPPHDLDVVWLCSTHHAKEHRWRRAEGAIAA